MRALLAIPLLAAALRAQAPEPPGLVRMTHELRAAIQSDSLTSAAEIATKLDNAVQAHYRAWLVRDSRERVDEVLTWVAADTESLWVNLEPFVIDREQSLALLYGRPTQGYALDRLMRSSAALRRMACAAGCSEYFSAVAATRKRSAEEPRAGRMAVTSGAPRVRVPVLSRTTVSTTERVSI